MNFPGLSIAVFAFPIGSVVFLGAKMTPSGWRVARRPSECLVKGMEIYGKQVNLLASFWASAGPLYFPPHAGCLF